MKIILLCVFYPPLKVSAAIQILDLAKEFRSQGHDVIVITPDSTLKKSFTIQNDFNIKTIRVKSGMIRDIGLFRRALNEFLMPFQMIYRLFNISYILRNNDLLVWWSPSIFFTPLILYLKILNRCKTYLILRDIFPQWAIDLGIIKSRIIASIFKFFYNIQFLASDLVGIQSVGDAIYIPKKIFRKKIKFEVLNNWYTPSSSSNKKIEFDLSSTILKSRKIFVYAGNIGLAQDVELLINLANSFRNNNEIGFLFIGRGSLYENLKKLINKKSLSNVVLHEEITNSEIQNIYRSCFAGLISLNSKHTTNNIPGKFISYLHSGLPVFAVVNRNNNIIDIINKNDLGIATNNINVKTLKIYLLNFINNISNDPNISMRCQEFASKHYNTRKIARQIITSSKNL